MLLPAELIPNILRCVPTIRLLWRMRRVAKSYCRDVEWEIFCRLRRPDRFRLHIYNDPYRSEHAFPMVCTEYDGRLRILTWKIMPTSDAAARVAFLNFKRPAATEQRQVWVHLVTDDPIEIADSGALFMRQHDWGEYQESESKPEEFSGQLRLWPLPERDDLPDRFSNRIRFRPTYLRMDPSQSDRFQRGSCIDVDFLMEYSIEKLDANENGLDEFTVYIEQIRTTPAWILRVLHSETGVPWMPLFPRANLALARERFRIAGFNDDVLYPLAHVTVSGFWEYETLFLQWLHQADGDKTRVDLEKDIILPCREIRAAQLEKAAKWPEELAQRVQALRPIVEQAGLLWTPEFVKEYCGDAETEWDSEARRRLVKSQITAMKNWRTERPRIINMLKQVAQEHDAPWQEEWEDELVGDVQDGWRENVCSDDFYIESLLHQIR